MGLEIMHMGLLNALQELGWIDHASWAVQPQNTEVTDKERAAARRLIDAIQAMEDTIDHVHDLGRKMRPTREEMDSAYDQLLRQQAERARANSKSSA